MCPFSVHAKHSVAEKWGISGVVVDTLGHRQCYCLIEPIYDFLLVFCSPRLTPFPIYYFLSLTVVEYGPHLIHSSLSPPKSSTQTAAAYRSVQPFRRAHYCDRRTDYATRSVTVACIYIRSTAMWPKCLVSRALCEREITASHHQRQQPSQYASDAAGRQAGVSSVG